MAERKLFILQHQRDTRYINDEIKDAGYVPCGVFDNFMAAVLDAEVATQGGGGFWAEEPQWKLEKWLGVQSCVEMYQVGDIWCQWRITELTLNKFVLEYADLENE